jgi:CheY-like chemotaxis protein
MSSVATQLATKLPAEPKAKLCALVLEDNQLDAELVLRALRQGGFEVTGAVVQDEAGFTKALHANPPEIVLADYNLPNWTGMEALNVLRREALDIPMILVSGALGDVTAVECIKRGVTDYVLKDGLARLPDVVRRALREKLERSLPTPTSSSSPTSPRTICRNRCAWSRPTRNCWPSVIAESLTPMLTNLSAMPAKALYACRC